MEELRISKRKGKLIHIRLSPSTHTRLKIRVAELRTTLQSWTEKTIRNALRKKIKFGKQKPLKQGEANEPTK